MIIDPIYTELGTLESEAWMRFMAATLVGVSNPDVEFCGEIADRALVELRARVRGLDLPHADA